MVKRITHNNTIIEYDLRYKKVKNINVRIKPDGSVNVSANKRVPEKIIDEFIKSKSDFIIKALEKYKNIKDIKPIQHFEEDKLKSFILELCEKVYPYYRQKGITFPTVKFRKMTSRWGSCHTEKGILTFNINLIFAPKECVEYVVLHEFTHFLVPNHSKEFYIELEKVCPDWKQKRKMLKAIVLS